MRTGIRTTVYCRTSFEGFHEWPDAPEEVFFLRNNHRHIFHVTVEVPVSHSDRDVEFILLKRRVDAFIKEQNTHLVSETWSCEQWALALLVKFDAFRVEVSEDGENGAIVEAAP